MHKNINSTSLDRMVFCFIFYMEEDITEIMNIIFLFLVFEFKIFS